MFYQIKETLEKCNIDDISNREFPYVAIVTREEFEINTDIFDMGIDLGFENGQLGVTSIQVNYDSLTGHFVIPEFNSDNNKEHIFSFAIDERGIVFINDDGTAQKIINAIIASKRWKFPSLERFIYDFLEQIVNGDLAVLGEFEKELDVLEDKVIEGKFDGIMERVVEIRSQIIDLRFHYEQLIDIAQELEENENHFFRAKNLRFFRLFNERVGRLLNFVASIREHTILVRDLYSSQLQEKQNKNMAYLTVIATIFTPLTLITGWFGMNFKYMPELDEPWAYPAVAGVCILIAVISIIFFKKKKWM